MKVGRIYKINVGVALLYFVIVLATTILTMIMGVANQNNMALRIISVSYTHLTLPTTSRV